MNKTRIALGIAVLATLPWGAKAQDDGAEHVGARLWFEQYIAPTLGRHHDDMSVERPPVLYDPREAAPIPGRDPERTLYRHSAQAAGWRGVVLAGDLPPTRAERIDVRDWNDATETANPMRRELFRFYLEPVEPTPPICRAIQ